MDTYTYTVAADLVVDIMQTILKSNIPYTITDTSIAQNALIITISGDAIYAQAKQDIEDDIKEYNEFRYGLFQLEVDDE